MKALLSPSWELSTEHAACSCGQPVLVHRPSGEAYGPGDIVRAYPSHGYATAANTVKRLAKRVHLNAAGRALVAQFTGMVEGSRG